MKKLFFLLLFCLLTTGGNNAKAQDLGDLLRGEGLEGILDGLSKDDETNIVSMIFALERLAEIESPVFDFSPHINCLYILVKYANTFENLVEKTNAASDCNERHGLLVMQEAMLLASTNIYYCVEPFLEMIENYLTLEESKKEAEELVAEMQYFHAVSMHYTNNYKGGKKDSKIFNELLIDLMNTITSFYDFGRHPSNPNWAHRAIVVAKLKQLINEYFDAQLVIKKALLIAEHIEALPCDGG